VKWFDVVRIGRVEAFVHQAKFRAIIKKSFSRQAGEVESRIADKAVPVTLRRGDPML
jgi:hypothetical protein